MDAALHQRSPLAQDPDAHLEGLGLADGVVDDVDPARVGHRQALERLDELAARPGGELLDDLQAVVGRQHERRPQPAGQVGLGVEPGHHRHLHVGIQGPEHGDGRAPERSGPVDEDLAAGRGAGGG